MPKHSWFKQQIEQEFDQINSLLPDLSDPEAEEEEFRNDFFQGLSGRRKKAAFVLSLVYGIVIMLYYLRWGDWLVSAFSLLFAIMTIRLILAKPESPPPPLSETELTSAPQVSLLVSAQNEEAVVTNLVEMLCSLDYPQDKYEVCIVNDRSTDKTGEILDSLITKYPALRVVHRDNEAGGGKSGALNQVLSATKGEIIGVFDADAGVPQDLLRHVVPLFTSDSKLGAVQVRKAIANPNDNFWTRGQTTEMVLDAYLQQQRIACGGIGELRGNGQFVRRTALESCGGWNEHTITDDLDLTIRLHLDAWKIGLLESPPVREEAVKSVIALWHQRNRWAEGGYQRYLDYWRFLVNQPLGLSKRLDLYFFVLMQYILPTATLPDMVMAFIYHRLPLLAPANTIVFAFTFWAGLAGLIRSRKTEKITITLLLKSTFASLQSLVYMLHWLIIMPSVTLRMSIRPKKLKWVKTVHEGSFELKNS
ncbi:MAG: glycosyltransferase family 2 protein [Cyanobacteria bacterium J083]|nr:MAG: glycosyltransferase family 2 protein [Cyanobacteria bacterium J083]